VSNELANGAVEQSAGERAGGTKNHVKKWTNRLIFLSSSIAKII